MEKFIKDIRKRVEKVDREMAESRAALRAWKENEQRKLDRLEAESLAKDEAIDVECVDDPKPLVLPADRPADLELATLKSELQELLAAAKSRSWANDLVGADHLTRNLRFEVGRTNARDL